MRRIISAASALTLALAARPANGEQRPGSAAQSAYPEPKDWTPAEDHQHMMAQLGIRALRPGPSGDELAWRQHDSGHTAGPNWKYFLSWADHHFGRRYTAAPPVPVSASASTQPAGAAAPAQEPPRAPRADVPLARTDSNSMLAHQLLLAKRTQGKIDVYFLGNSITRRWGATDYPELLDNWNANFFGWNAANFGWGADRTEHMLWRIENGELDDVNPRVIVLLAGTNNVGRRPGGDEKVADITRGIKKLIALCQRKAPNATIIVTGITPRNDNIAVVPEINRINENIARFADGRSIRYLNINNQLAGAEGDLFDGMTVDGLHLSVKGYQLWADALAPILTEILGPPAETDQAPPPTGDPSAVRRIPADQLDRTRGVVLQKLVIDPGETQPTYLRPPESYWRDPHAPEASHSAKD